MVWDLRSVPGDGEDAFWAIYRDGMKTPFAVLQCDEAAADLILEALRWKESGDDARLALPSDGAFDIVFTPAPKRRTPRRKS